MKVHKLMKVILSFLTILFMLGSGNNNLTLAQGNQQGGRDVTDGTKIKITNFKIFRTNETTEVEKLSLRTGYDLQFDWDATAYGTTLKEGDYFTVGVPKQMNIDRGQAGKTLSIKDGEGNLVATAVITRFEDGGGHIKFTFTNFVNTHGNIKGNFKMSFILNETHTKANEKNNLVMTIDKTTIPIKPGGIEVVPSGTQNPTEILGKWAVSQVLTTLYQGGEHLVIKDPEVLKEIGKGATRWLLRINVKKDNLSNAVISDQLHGEELGNITMIPGTFALFEGDVDENGSAINTKNYKNISNDVQLSLDKRSFSYNLGNVQGKTYFLVYYTTYEDGSKLRPKNKARLAYNVDKLIEKSTYFKQAEAGGVGQGDNANKIQIRKFDQDNASKPLANAIFELYEQDKVTPVKHNGKPIVLETNGEGKAQSPQLIAGTYYLKEIKAPDGYLLPKEAGNNTEGEGKDNFYKAVVDAAGVKVYISNKFGGTSVSGEKTWDDNNDQDGKRPQKITVILKKTVNGQTSEVKRQDVTPNSEGKWKYEFTNLPFNISNKRVTVDFEATKTWVNGKATDYKEVKLGLYVHKEGQTVEDAKPVTGNYTPEVTVSNGVYTYKWKNQLPERDVDGSKLVYSVRELQDQTNLPLAETETVVGGTSDCVVSYNADKTKITNTYKPAKINVTAKKVWTGGNENIRPTVYFKLYRTPEGGAIEEVAGVEKKEVPKTDGTVEWTDLPATDEHGVKYTYSVMEVDEDGNLVTTVDGYTSEQTAELTVTNKYSVKPTSSSLEVTKKLIGRELKADEFEFTLTDQVGNVETAKNDANGKVKFKELTFDEVGTYTYKIAEKAGTATGIKYDTKIITATVTVADNGKGALEATIAYDGEKTFENTYTPEKRTIEGQKIWNDNNNQDGKRPTSIKVKLYKKVGNNNQEYVTEKVVTEGADKAWKWKFENLDKYENKQEIQYTVEEEVVANGYAGVVTGSMAAGFKITNSYTPEAVNVQGTKTWNDANNQDGKRPDKIKVILNKTVDGKTTKVAEKEVTKDNWNYEFTNLPKYEGGKEITYSIDEEAVPGYEKSIDGYNLKNSYTPEAVNVQGTKTWNDANNQDGKRPGSIRVILNKTVDGKTTKVAEKEVTAKDNWNYAFNDLPKYENGKLIEYSIDEVDVPGYEKTIKGYNLENKYIPKKPGLPKTGSTPSEVGGLGVLGLLAGYVLIRRKNKAN